ncbi:MAG: hypothetical protein R2991_11825 [Thermoanaerobaculia bacterium]
MRKNLHVIVALAAVVALIGALTLAEAQEIKPSSNPPRDPSAALTRPGSGSAGPRPEVLGTIIYDNGIVTALPAASSNCFGNQFNTANGNAVMAAGSVTAMSYFLTSGSGTDNVFVSVFGSVDGGGNASVLTSVSVPLNNGPGAFNTHTFAAPINYPGASFLAGVWYVSGDVVGLGSGTNNGQGFHGMLINDIVGTGFTPLPGLNALVGASGDVLGVPVELQSVTID